MRPASSSEPVRRVDSHSASDRPLPRDSLTVSFCSVSPP